MNLNTELDLFLRSHKRKASTAVTYGEIIRPFVQYCSSGSHAAGVPPQRDITTTTVTDYLLTRELAPATYNQYLSAISTFLYERRLISRDDRDELHRHRTRIEQSLYSEHALTDGQVLAFFTYLRRRNARSNPVRQQRDLCIFLLQYACALRISEVLTLRRDDIVEQANGLYIRIRTEHSKNGVERTVPLRYRLDVAGMNVSAEIKTWLRITNSTGLCFYNLRSEQYGTPVQYRRMIAKYNNIMHRLGIEHTGATHAMRHTRITQLANNPEIPMNIISEFAGHVSKGRPNIRTTALYIRRPGASDVAEYL